MSCVDINTGQSHFRYGLDLLFEDELFLVPAGNAVYFEKKIKGFFGGVFDALADVWGGIVGAFEAAAKAVGDAVSDLYDMIYDNALRASTTTFGGLGTMNMHIPPVMIFSYNLLNQLSIDAGNTFWYGFQIGFWQFILPILIGVLVGNIIWAIAGLPILLIIIGAIVEIGLIMGMIAMAGLRYSDTEGKFVDKESITLYDAYAYANGWTKLGILGGIFGASHPQIENADMAENIGRLLQ